LLESLAALLPEPVTIPAALALIGASFMTSAFTAAFGLGGGITMLAFMGAFLPVSALIPVHGAVQLGSNTGRAWHLRHRIRWTALRPFVAGGLIGAAAGGLLVVELPDGALKLMLGLFILAVTWARLPGLQRLSGAGLLAGGALISALSMFLGATGPLAAAFFGQVVSDDRRGLIATLAAAMTALHGLKIAVFGFLGFGFWQWLPLISAMIATGYLGTVAGARLLSVLSEATFRFWFRMVLTLLALDLVRRGLILF
jgi:uncharacterized membrane protein YfcA